MNDIITIITSVGASGLIGGAIVWLFRSWISERLRSSIQHEYNQKLEAHKSKLQYENETAIERLRSELHIAATERNVKITKLNEEMAETISRTFALLNNLRIAVLDYTKPIEMSGEPSKEEKKATVARRMMELEEYFFPRQIYLPRDLAIKVHELSTTAPVRLKSSAGLDR